MRRRPGAYRRRRNQLRCEARGRGLATLTKPLDERMVLTTMPVETLCRSCAVIRPSMGGWRESLDASLEACSAKPREVGGGIFARARDQALRTLTLAQQLPRHQTSQLVGPARLCQMCFEPCVTTHASQHCCCPDDCQDVLGCPDSPYPTFPRSTRSTTRAQSCASAHKESALCGISSTVALWLQPDLFRTWPLDSEGGSVIPCRQVSRCLLLPFLLSVLWVRALSLPGVLGRSGVRSNGCLPRYSRPLDARPPRFASMDTLSCLRPAWLPPEARWRGPSHCSRRCDQEGGRGRGDNGEGGERSSGGR